MAEAISRLSLYQILLLICFAVFLPITAYAASPAQEEIELFTREGCPRCDASKEFVKSLGASRPGMRIMLRDVMQDSAALDRLQMLAKQQGLSNLAVAAFHVRGQFIIGFAGPDTTGARILSLLDQPALLSCALLFLCRFLPSGNIEPIRGTVIASISIILGMWLERFVIIVPTLTKQRLPVEGAYYIPTWVEWSILAGGISLFTLLYVLFTKVFPSVPIWEIREGREKAVTQVGERIRSYLPEQDTLDK